MIKIFKYTFYDLMRNRWMFIYTAFFLITTLSLLLLSPDLAKFAISVSNITIVLTPLVAMLFGVIYYHGSEDYIQLLLAQPIARSSIFIGIFAGMAASLSCSILIGIGLPGIFYGILHSSALLTFLTVTAMAIVLSIIFSLLAFLISMFFKNHILGFGVAIFIWLFFAIIYDGIFLLLLLLFNDYPLENLTIALTMSNPIDLARILNLLQMDFSAMMGYTGAVLQNFMGNAKGAILIISVLALWIIIPFLTMLKLSKRQDF